MRGDSDGDVLRFGVESGNGERWGIGGGHLAGCGVEGFCGGEWCGTRISDGVVSWDKKDSFWFIVENHLQLEHMYG